ncbi:MAG TPA: phosphate acyltransferase, partial [Candidatus Wallbacteria bacterium]|nr:phosphate acyltransferase [Candidatus Wallbacteria bacterium]
MKIAVDAMGGDHAPFEIVKGAFEVAAELPELGIILVGDQNEIKKVEGYKDMPNVLIRHASSVISFNDDPVSRSTQNSI